MTKNLLKAVSLGLIGMLSACGNKNPENTKTDELALQQQERIERSIAEYGYGIMPSFRADDLWMGIYSDRCRYVAIETKEGDTLGNLANTLYKERLKWNRLASNSGKEFDKFKEDDTLSRGLHIKTYMWDFQLSEFKKDFSDRQIQILEDK